MKRITFILIFVTAVSGMVFSQNSEYNSPPKASFTNSSPFIVENGTVSYSDESTGLIQNYYWLFEGGFPDKSFNPNPVVMYPEHGTYTVKLVVSNQAGSDSIIKDKLIHVHAKQTWGDTLNWPLVNDTLYQYVSGGYISGTNSKNPKYIANYFHADDVTNIITQVCIDFRVMSSDTTLVYFALYDTLGVNGSPGNELFHTLLNADSIRSAINNNKLYSVNCNYFTNWPVYIRSFHVVLKLPNFSADTLVVSSGIAGSTPNYAWVNFDSTWIPFSDTSAYSMNLTLGIFPITSFYINNVNESTTNHNITIFPNPANEQINLQTKDNTSLPQGTLQIFNMQGALQMELAIPKHQSQVQLNLSHLPAGLYLGRIVGRNGDGGGFRFVKE